MKQTEIPIFEESVEYLAHKERVLRTVGGVAAGEVASINTFESYLNSIPDISREIAVMREQGGVYIPGFMPEEIAKLFGREFIGYQGDKWNTDPVLEPSESFIGDSQALINGNSFLAVLPPEHQFPSRKEEIEEIQLGYELVRESIFSQLKKGFDGKYDDYSVGSGLDYGGQDLIGYFDRGIKWHRDEERFVGGAASLAVWGEADFAWVDYEGRIQRVRQKPGDLVLFANHDPDHPDMSDTRPHMVSPPHNPDKIRLTDIIRFIDINKNDGDREAWLAQEAEVFRKQGIPIQDLNEETQDYMNSATS